METLNFQSKYKWKISNLYFWKSNEFSGQVKFFFGKVNRKWTRKEITYIYMEKPRTYMEKGSIYIR
jgi:hypothetical protein